MPTFDIPMLDLVSEVEDRWEEFSSAVHRVLRSGRYILGPEVDAFEQELSDLVGRPVVGVASGTDAVVLAIRALDIGPGDEVITTPFSFVATASSILHAGATPVFCDIDEASFNLDPKAVADAITPRTRAILPVHLFGHPAAMAPLAELSREHGLAVIEDAAQALGATVDGKAVGTMGDTTAFSFFPAKNLGAFGDGGAVAARDEATAEKVRMLRSHGSRRKYHNEILGYNSRLDAMQAAILRVKLQHFAQDQEGRRSAAQRYHSLLEGVEGIVLPSTHDGVGHVWQQYTIRVLGGRRDEIKAALAERGIASMIYYPVPLPALPLFEPHRRPMPRAERAAAEVLSLPMGPRIAADAQERVAAALKEALGGSR